MFGPIARQCPLRCGRDRLERRSSRLSGRWCSCCTSFPEERLLQRLGLLDVENKLHLADFFLAAVSGFFLHEQSDGSTFLAALHDATGFFPLVESGKLG